MSKDAGHDETEKVLKEIEKRISREYKQAEKEVAAKLDDYLKKFETKDKAWQKWVADGTKTQKEYDQWRIGQICMGQRWDEQRKTLAQDFAKSSQIAKDITASKMPDVYAINHNYATFQIEQASMINTSYTLYDHKTVERLAKGDDKIIPVPGKKISRLIDEGKAVRWNERQIQSVMMQSLLQGESIPDIASRLAYSVGDSDRKASIRNARTLTTGVQNAGRVDSYERANEMGIQTAKQWIAALDDRTRHWHAELDGEIVENDEPFENEYGKIMYPGDPLADPANIYNCRCTLVAAIKGFDRNLSDRYDEKLGKMTYSQWKESKKSRAEDIEKQYKMSLKEKSNYIQKYSGLNTQSGGDGGKHISSPLGMRNDSKGNPNAVYHFDEPLNNRQQKILNNLPETDSRKIVKKSDVNMTDLSSMTAATGDEFALFTKGGQRLIIRGDNTSVNITEEEAKKLQSEGYRFSGHTHPTVGDLTASDGDYAILKAFKMKESVIYDPTGKYSTFELDEE